MVWMAFTAVGKTGEHRIGDLGREFQHKKSSHYNEYMLALR